MPNSSRIALSCCTCRCCTPLSIFTRHSLVMGVPRSSNRRTSSVCPMPFAVRISLMFFPMSPAAFCLIFCPNLPPLYEPVSALIYFYCRRQLEDIGTDIGPLIRKNRHSPMICARFCYVMALYLIQFHLFFHSLNHRVMPHTSPSDISSVPEQKTKQQKDTLWTGLPIPHPKQK